MRPIGDDDDGHGDHALSLLANGVTRIRPKEVKGAKDNERDANVTLYKSANYKPCCSCCFSMLLIRFNLSIHGQSKDLKSH